MNKVARYVWGRRTTALGYVQVTIAVLAASSGVFSPGQLSTIILVNALLTAWLGHYNNSRIKAAEAAVAGSENEAGV